MLHVPFEAIFILYLQSLRFSVRVETNEKRRHKWGIVFEKKKMQYSVHMQRNCDKNGANVIGDMCERRDFETNNFYFVANLLNALFELKWNKRESWSKWKRDGKLNKTRIKKKNRSNHLITCVINGQLDLDDCGFDFQCNKFECRYENDTSLILQHSCCK